MSENVVPSIEDQVAALTERVENIATYLKSQHKKAPKAQESEPKGIFCANCSPSGSRFDPSERVYHASLAEAKAAHTNG